MKLFLAFLHLLIFLSLKVASSALPMLAKIGCNDTCGNNVTIPYPFGIGADCSINQWYVVECNSSKPFLPALNQLEVLSVTLENQTVTVSTPMMSDCQKPVWSSNEIMGVDLGRSPFVFSKSHNIFVFKGCGIAFMMDSGSVLIGCSTSCRNVTLSDKNKCYGIRCCRSAVPRYLKSYTINITRLGEKNGGCGSAFLMDKASYEVGKFPNPFIVRDTSFVPMSLVWTLTDSDNVTCCNRDTHRSRVDIFNGTPVDTLTCDIWSINEGNPYLIDGCMEYNTPKYAKTGCKDKCGNVTIPFPFGIGMKCSINQWYIVNCTSFTPYLSALNHLELLRVDLKNHTFVVSMRTPRISDCQSPVRNSIQTMGIDLGRSPFLFSKLQNKFVFEGCGNAVIMDNGSVITGCSTACRNFTHSNRNKCFGISCCQTTIPHYFKSYDIKLTGFEEEDEGCGAAFMVDETLYDQRRVADPFNVTRDTSFIPVSLTWTLTDTDEANCYQNNVETLVLDMSNCTPVKTWHCYGDQSCEGNPYLIDGCMINTNYNNDEDPTGECRRCEESGGYCSGDKIYDLDGLLSAQNFTCYHYHFQKRISMGVILGASMSMGLLFLVAIGYALYQVIKRSKEKGRVMSIFDALVIKEATRDELLIAANLAMRCLNFNGKHRPTMKEVAMELETIRRSHIPSMVQTTKSPVVYRKEPSIPSMVQTTTSTVNGEELSTQSYGESSSTFLSFNDGIAN
ncbi:hypothetical protein QVD17_37386 [Tagetes erecta]|uniref:Uncharacterized protein n=1 Tax=Tagetes erecta TaxID=13708 RepID=A0AAD8K0E8_TARER|nr:hypothetical protein QVD17_37386 [Tagetes erecta]